MRTHTQANHARTKGFQEFNFRIILSAQDKNDRTKNCEFDLLVLNKFDQDFSKKKKNYLRDYIVCKISSGSRAPKKTQSEVCFCVCQSADHLVMVMVYLNVINHST